MPQIKSAYKRLRQDKKKHLRNKAKISELRTLAKSVRILISENKKDDAEKAVRQYESRLFKAVKTNLIKKNNASRRISRLRKQLDQVSA